MRKLVRHAKRPGSADWKRIVLKKRWWPNDLAVPRPHRLPEDAEHVRENPDWSQRFRYYLFRHCCGTKYYFRVWDNDDGDGSVTERRDCIELSPVEAERLLILQEVSQTVADDARRFRAKNRVRKSR
jgi:hypothetical protein